MTCLADEPYDDYNCDESKRSHVERSSSYNHHGVRKLLLKESAKKRALQFLWALSSGGVNKSSYRKNPEVFPELAKLRYKLKQNREYIRRKAKITL